MQDKQWMDKTLLFADGDHGSALQVHSLHWGEDETGIVMVWARKNRQDKGARRFYFRDTEYEFFPDALAAWKNAGSPVEEPRPAIDYMAPKNFKRHDDGTDEGRPEGEAGGGADRMAPDAGRSGADDHRPVRPPRDRKEGR